MILNDHEVIAKVTGNPLVDAGVHLRRSHGAMKNKTEERIDGQGRLDGSAVVDLPDNIPNAQSADIEDRHAGRGS